MNIEKLKPSNAVLIVIFTSIVCNILLLIYLNDKKFFLTTDIFKLLIIGIGLAIPVIGLNSVYSVLFIDSATDSDDNEEGFLSIAAFGCLFSIIVLSMLTFLKIFINLSYVGITICFFILQTILFFAIHLREKRLKKRIGFNKR